MTSTLLNIAGKINPQTVKVFETAGRVTAELDMPYIVVGGEHKKAGGKSLMPFYPHSIWGYWSFDRDASPSSDEDLFNQDRPTWCQPYDMASS